jgi:DNA invertase Pin-like site-specific DNA recombinase
MNDIVNAEIIDYAKNNDVKHIITIEISRISRKLSSFALFLENCNASGINIIIDNYKLHTLLDGKPNNMVQTMLSIASTFATMEVNILQQRLQSGRAKYIKGGGVLGRKIGSTKTDTELLKQHADIVKYLRQGLSIRTIAKITCKSGVTVQKLKKIIHTTS